VLAHRREVDPLVEKKVEARPRVPLLPRPGWLARLGPRRHPPRLRELRRQGRGRRRDEVPPRPEAGSQDRGGGSSSSSSGTPRRTEGDRGRARRGRLLDGSRASSGRGRARLGGAGVSPARAG